MFLELFTRRTEEFSDELPFLELETLEIADEYRLVVTSQDGQWSRGKVRPTKSAICAQLLKEEGREASGFKLKDLGHLFHHLPIELFYEILTYLRPVDLLRVARTTKYLRSLVMRYSSAWVWVLAFARNPSVPPCPDDMPHPKWVDLLFGPPICQMCGADEANADYTMRRRLCSTCSHKHMMHHRQKPNEMLNHMLIFSQHDAAQRKAKCKSDWALQHEIFQELADKLQTLRHSRKARYHETWTECNLRLRDLMVHPMTKDRVASIDKCVATCEAWQMDILRRSERDDRATQEILKKRLRHRVVQLGYQSADLDEVLKYPWHTDSFLMAIGVNPRNPLRSLRRDWTKIQPRFKVVVAVLAKDRLATERSKLIASRQRSVEVLYNRALVDVVPQVSTVPKAREALLLKPFIELVNLPSEVTLSDEEWSKTIRRFIARWPPKNLGELSMILPADTVPSPDPAWERCGIYSAAAVFSCVACTEHRGPGLSPGSCLVGWKEAMDHGICLRLRSQHPFEICERGCAAARSVLACLDLDIDTPPRILDNLGAELTCAICWNRSILSWWDCIAHFIDTSHARAHDTPSWKVISRSRGSQKAGAVWRGFRAT